MKFNILLNTAFKDIIKNKKRSVLTMLGIIIGIAAVITIIAIGRGFQDYVVDSLMGGEGKELSVAFFFQPENQQIQWEAIHPSSQRKIFEIFHILQMS